VVYAAAIRAVGRARACEGPTFLLLNTYRFLGHHVGDVDRVYYRSSDEEGRWRAERDPLSLFTAWLDAQGVEADTLERIQSDVRAAVDAGVEAALAAPFPDPDEVDEDVYA
jgi:acetoin:2,6-dichlorophenolindophenol oxidoreductase subunit alpha